MFWYIGGILAGFAIGYVVAISQNRKRGGYKKGVNDCRNCKNMVYVSCTGIVRCKAANMFLTCAPKACGNYQHIDDTEGGS